MAIAALKQVRVPACHTVVRRAWLCWTCTSDAAGWCGFQQHSCCVAIRPSRSIWTWGGCAADVPAARGGGGLGRHLTRPPAAGVAQGAVLLLPLTEWVSAFADGACAILVSHSGPVSMAACFGHMFPMPCSYQHCHHGGLICVCVLQSLRNTTPVPRHWSQKRKYLQVWACCHLVVWSHDSAACVQPCIHPCQVLRLQHSGLVTACSINISYL